MRIIAGSHRGRPLIAPKDRAIRPTTDRIREALFSALDARGAVRGAQVIDLFAGTGALGFEALSRGAAHVTFIEQAPASLRLIRDNAQALDLEAHCTWVKGDATGPLKANGPFTLLFCDAPYAKGLSEPALRAARPLLEDALCVVELDKREDFTVPGGFLADDEKTYGDTRLVFLTTSS